MQLSVTGKQIDVGQALRSHVGTGLEAAVGKYFDHAIEANVVFSRNAHNYQADIKVHVGRGILIQGQGTAGDPYLAFNAASEHIAKRLRRHKRRLRDHHRAERAAETLSALQYVLAAESESDEQENEAGTGEPVVVAEMTTYIPMLTVSEAVMMMDLSDAPALMFRNSAHGGLNMVYRRTDGNVGWVDPQGTRERAQ
ncbi:MAG: ribosome hibernation-promoting factor, HPF/YfiA family [Candidatus Eiseniibacteriota bacterium]